jgi:hypothetical protein
MLGNLVAQLFCQQNLHDGNAVQCGASTQCYLLLLLWLLLFAAISPAVTCILQASAAVIAGCKKHQYGCCRPDCRYPTNPMSKDDMIAMIGNLVVAGTLPAATAAAYTL